MAKFRVHFEASAAIGIEIEIDAADEDSAQRIAQALYGEGRQEELRGLVADLLKPSPESMVAYAEELSLPVTYVTIEEDENGFEVVDVVDSSCQEVMFP